MQTYNVGGPFLPTQGKGEGVFFDADAGGYTLVFNFSRPTEKEIASVKSSEPFEIRYTSLNDILYITVKAGSLEWVDMPFAPWLSDRYEQLVIPENENEGSALSVYMVDANTNVLKSMRLIGLGHKFSVSMLEEIRKIRFKREGKPVSMSEYNAEVARVQQAYTTKELVKMASARFKL